MFAAVCNILYTQQWKVSRKKHKDSNHTVATFPRSQQQQQDESLEYEEIPTTQSGSSDIMELHAAEHCIYMLTAKGSTVILANWFTE